MTREGHRSLGTAPTALPLSPDNPSSWAQPSVGVLQCLGTVPSVHPAWFWQPGNPPTEHPGRPSYPSISLHTLGASRCARSGLDHVPALTCLPAAPRLPAACQREPACDSISSKVPWQRWLPPLLHTDHLQAGSWGHAAEPRLCQRHVAAGTGERATRNSSCTWRGQDRKVIPSSAIGMKPLAEILALSCSGLPPNCSRETRLSGQGKDVLSVSTG